MKDFLDEGTDMSTLKATAAFRGFSLSHSPAHAGFDTGHVSPISGAGISTDEFKKLVPTVWTDRYQLWGKRLLDVLIVLLLLPITLPIILISALFVALDGHPAFFWQERVGKDGQKFQMLKLRTMVADAEALLEDVLANDPAMASEWRRTQKLKNDPRITKFGKFLRKSSIDELPQIWNVLVGEMSVVGPRPMLPEQADIHGDTAVYFAMRPGITGPWQVSERNEDDFAARARADRFYLDACSLRMDINLLFRTVGVVLRRTGY